MGKREGSKEIDRVRGKVISSDMPVLSGLLLEGGPSHTHQGSQDSFSGEAVYAGGSEARLRAGCMHG